MTLHLRSPTCRSAAPLHAREQDHPAQTASADRSTRRQYLRLHLHAREPGGDQDAAELDRKPVQLLAPDQPGPGFLHLRPGRSARRSASRNSKAPTWAARCGSTPSWPPPTRPSYARTPEPPLTSGCGCSPRPAPSTTARSVSSTSTPRSLRTRRSPWPTPVRGVVGYLGSAAGIGPLT